MNRLNRLCRQPIVHALILAGLAGLAGCGDGGPASIGAAATSAESTATQAGAGASTKAATDTWQRLGNEWDTVTVPANSTVRYGANGVYVQKTVSGTFRVTNDFFGSDPLPGVVKAVDLLISADASSAAAASGTWQRLGNEWDTVTVPANTTVRYGANGSYVQKVVSGSFRVTNDFFGIDPLPGVVKAADALVAADASATPAAPAAGGSWQRLGNEWDTVSVPANSTVRYGANGSYVQKVVSGTFRVTNDFFGIDPLPGVVKAVDLLVTGSDAAPTPAPAPAPAPSSGVTLDAPEQSAFDRLNAVRAAAGVAPLALSSSLVTSSERHARYVSGTDEVGHYETNTGAADYSGYAPSDRVRAAGGTFSVMGEVLTRIVGSDPVQAFDSFLGAIYHRFGVLAGNLTTAGVGVQTKTASGTALIDLTIDMTATTPAPAPATGTLTLWPADNASGLPGGFDSDTESPDPVPEAGRVGYPVSVQAYPGQSLSVGSFTLRRASDGASVAVKLLSGATDSGRTPGHAAAIVPTAPLAPNTAYVASFQGAVDGRAVNRTWQFSTAPLTLTADRTTVSPGQAVQFAIGGLDPSERYYWCVNNSALLGGASFLSPSRFSMTARAGCNASSCPVTVSFSFASGCASPAGSVTVQVTR